MTAQNDSHFVFQPPIGDDFIIFEGGHSIPLSAFFTSVREEMVEQELSFEDAVEFVIALHHRIARKEL